MNCLLPTRFVKGMKLPLVVVLLFVVCGRVQAQQPSLASSPAASHSGISSTATEGTTSGGARFAPRSALTASQIDEILQEKPEVVIEIKSLMAQQVQQQGIDAQADSISDEMLYQQISSNADLRNSITLWLRARGYVSDADLQRLLAEDESSSASPIAQSLGTISPLANSSVPQNESYPANNIGGLALKSNSFSLPGTAGAVKTQSDQAEKKLERNTTDSPEVLRLPAPYNLLSLRDLYTQLPSDSPTLKRFGSDVFLNRSNKLNNQNGFALPSMSVDVPVGPDYVLGIGDGLVINLSGGVSQSLNRLIDREGRIVLPEAGTLVVAGLTLRQAQSAIEDALKEQFHNAKVEVSVARLRSVRVYVVGDVQRPGAYNLNSLSTPLNALYAAGGPTSVGSLRVVRHYRGKQLIREVDLYDFLLHGVRMEMNGFKMETPFWFPRQDRKSRSLAW